VGGTPHRPPAPHSDSAHTRLLDLPLSPHFPILQGYPGPLKMDRDSLPPLGDQDTPFGTSSPHLYASFI